MCVSVCLSVRVDISGTIHTRDLYQIFMDVAYGCSSVLLRQGDEILRERRNFGVFFPIDNALYSIAFGTIQKRLTDRDAVWDDEWA